VTSLLPFSDDLMKGPEMFEKTFGPKWGPRLWKISFSFALFALLAVGFGQIWGTGKSIAQDVGVVGGSKIPPYGDKSPSIGNCNNFGSNNTNCNTFNFGAQKLVFTDEVGRELVAAIENKNKKVFVRLNGVSEYDRNIKQQVMEFLSRNGILVEPASDGTWYPPKEKRLWIDEFADHYIVTVTPTAS
jgi:hypothetical protein